MALIWETDVQGRYMRSLERKELLAKRLVRATISEGSGKNRGTVRRMRLAWASLEAAYEDSKYAGRAVKEAARVFAKLFPKQVLEHFDDHAGFMRKMISTYEAIREAKLVRRDSWRAPTSRHTRFYLAAMQLESEAGTTGEKAYWATPHEMLARAFADWLHLELSQAGRRNDYLTRDMATLYEEHAMVAGGGHVPHLSRIELMEVQPLFRRFAGLFIRYVMAAEEVSSDKQKSDVTASVMGES